MCSSGVKKESIEVKKHQNDVKLKHLDPNQSHITIKQITKIKNLYIILKKKRTMKKKMH